jgi:hypothetical protein
MTATARERLRGVCLATALMVAWVVPAAAAELPLSGHNVTHMATRTTPAKAPSQLDVIRLASAAPSQGSELPLPIVVGVGY